MTPEQAQRTDRVLQAAIAELADARTPDYLEAAIERASSRPQRPSWTYPGRWLPLNALTTAVPTTRLPIRQVGIIALLGLLLAVATAVYIGSQTRLPAPYGPAANGHVAYAKTTDIVVADPATGSERTIVAGPEIDTAPRFSPDGSRIVFERQLPGAEPGSHVVVANADGSGLRTITDEPMRLVRSATTLPYAFAADSRTVAIAGYHPDGGPGLLLTSVDDGVPSRWLDLSRVAVPITSVREPAFRPTDPNTLLVTGDRSGDAGPIVFTVDVTSGDIQTVVQTTGFVGLDSARWSPDGQSISYTTWSNETMGLSVRTHLIGPDGTGDRLLPAPPEMVFDIGAAWSNDSTRLLLIRGFTSGWEDTRAAIVPADGSGLGVDIPYEGPIQGGCCYVWEWAPDDTKVLGKLIEPTGVPGRHVIVDVASASVSQAPWVSTDDPSWQRRAP